MQYLVIGSDGQEYGPASIPMLTEWAGEGRLHPHTSLKDVVSGALLTAAQVPGVFPQSAPPVTAPANQATMPTAGPPSAQAQSDWSQPPAPYYRPQAASGKHPGTALMWNSIIRSIGAVCIFFFVGGFGLIFGAYAVYYGYRAMESDHKYGKLAFGISILALAAVLAGWAFRINGSRV